jgi:hypothetical protein
MFLLEPADVRAWHPGQVMYFQNEARPGPVPSARSLEVLDAYFAWRRTPEGEAFGGSRAETRP